MPVHDPYRSESLSNALLKRAPATRSGRCQRRSAGAGSCPSSRSFARAAAIVTYPQYWSFRLTGVSATEVTSLGAHTDLWKPEARDYSTLVDRCGWRLGYGGGFYDRTLQGLRSRKPILAIGLAYDEQVVDAVPHLDYDEPLDWVLTPAGAIRCGR